MTITEGIIPARAGFTLLESQLFIVTRDHPRSRGVYTATAGEAPPLVRIIPARAGFTTAPDQLFT